MLHPRNPPSRESQIPCYKSKLRWGWVFLERAQILSGIQFTTHFIEFFVVETKRFVGRLVNVILTRQTCGQRSNRASESKRRALGNYFSERICNMFLTSKCRGDRDLGLCATSVLAVGEPQRNGKIRKENVLRRRKMGVCHCAAVLQTQVPKLCTDLDLGLLYICREEHVANSPAKIISYRSAFAFRSPARAQATGLPRQDHVYKSTDESFRFHYKLLDEMRCKLDSTENLRSFEKSLTPP